MKRMRVSDFARIQGIGKTKIRLKEDTERTIAKSQKEKGTGFQRIFDTEMKRLEGEIGESEETNKGTEADHGEERAELEELAGTMPGRRQC